MVQHLSIRVPWHDHGWDGTVCQDPIENTACLRLTGISDKKDGQLEESLCGQCIAGHEGQIPCLSEGGSFMSPTQFVAITKHPYVEYGYEEYKHLLPTENIYPPYSLPARPFAWLLKKSMHDLNLRYDLGIDEEAESNWPRGKNWLQFGESHRAVFDYFYKDVVPDKSLCLIYAKQVPFIEDSGRVIIGVGHIKNVSTPPEYKSNKKNGLKSVLWETHISHSIREDHKDGFLIPYNKLLRYAETHPEFDMRSVCVMAPSDAFEEFSYATEHVSYDAVIEVLFSCYKAFQKIDEILGGYSDVLEWIDARLNEVWEDRGAFPGLGSMFCSIKIKYGILVAKEVVEKTGKDDLWKTVDIMFSNPSAVLSSSLVPCIDSFAQKMWKGMTAERKTLFRLLSRFDISIAQADVLFQQNKRANEDIELSDADIISNPYLLYEGTRLKRDELSISVKRIDRAVFPVQSIQQQYPVPAPTTLNGDNDTRRVRALAVYALEQAAENGNTILPENQLIDLIQGMPLQPECGITIDHLAVIKDDISPVILVKIMKNGGKYYKLRRFEDFDNEIERKIRKKLKAGRIAIEADWAKMLDQYLKDMKIPPNPDSDKEARIRKEKIAALIELAESKVSVLVGDAGTGKTTVLAVLCRHPDIINGGVLLLAPTGKATVRLLDSMGESGNNFDAYNVAQFLSHVGGFNFKDMRYKIPRQRAEKRYETVIVDESSMLTEDMLGALMAAVGGAKRIIFVGDSNQLPPIGAGRPFVDLIKILKPEFGTKFPRVKHGYCELTENCRQASSGQRLDVEFAKMFTASRIDLERNIVTDILNGSNENIKFVRWNEKSDLHEKILEELSTEFGIKDQESFDYSLGGNRGVHNEPYSYFNRGSSSHIEDWQFLAPVKNMPHGVLSLNTFLHSTYRAEGMALAGRSGWNKKVASPWGHENIIYGDKVINVRNMTKQGYPKSTCRNYIANGEIGIACGDYKKRSWDDNSLEVEFSSQKGSYYFFDGRNFNEEAGTNDLELAYALTVHKAQGSQFDTVFLFLAEPCRILSREMLYTALTRQKKKIIIFYNDDPHNLMSYASTENSVISQRYTDLFSDFTLPDQSTYKPFVVKVGNTFYEDSLIHRTTNGELVRSKSEVIIADHLYSNHIPYRYEPEINVDGRIFRPDFMATDPDDDSIIWYWEHLGMPTDPNYMARWEEKLAYYNAHGIRENENLIVTQDGDNGGLDSKEIDDIIKDTFDL